MARLDQIISVFPIVMIMACAALQAAPEAPPPLPKLADQRDRAWKQATWEGNWYYKRADYKQALSAYRRAQKAAAPFGKTDIRTGITFMNLAKAIRDNAKEATQYRIKADEIYKAAIKDNAAHPMYPGMQLPDGYPQTAYNQPGVIKQVPTCFICGDNKDVLKVSFGLPGPDMAEPAKRGEVVFGGCCPQLTAMFHCKKCKQSF
jgi:hypothetical protein